MRPAFYAAGAGGWRDWWTLLHPPYTAWHLSYVVIGASLARQMHVGRLVATLLAFFLAVGVGAHALDELDGRPLGTRIASRWLAVAVAGGLAGAIALGALGVSRYGWTLLPFIIVGPALVTAYNMHLSPVQKDVVFALAWGAFPVLTAYVAQTERLAWPPVLAAVAAAGFSYAQRVLSTPARLLRRRAIDASASITMLDGTERALDRSAMLVPLERALHALAASLVVLATALALARLT